MRNATTTAPAQAHIGRHADGASGRLDCDGTMICVRALLLASSAAAFSLHGTTIITTPRHAAVTMIDETGKGAVGGAVLGGLLAGPFGALWGAQIGGAFGANNQNKKAQKEQLAAMGLNEDTMRLAQQTALELKDAESSLEIVRGAETSQKSLIRTLETNMEVAYAAAEAALRAGDEAGARAKLEEKAQFKAKKEAAEVELAAASSRVATMQASVASLAERANEIEQMISRTVTATKTRPSGDGGDVFGAPEDPLERRFRDLE